MSSPIVQAELLEETQQAQAQAQEEQAQQAEQAQQEQPQQPQECGETCDCSRCYDEAEADDDDADAEDEANQSFHTESKFTFKVQAEKGATLSFTVFEDDDEKKVHLELSEPMTLPLNVLQGYIREISDDYSTSDLDDKQAAPCALLISAVVCFLLTVFLTSIITMSAKRY